MYATRGMSVTALVGCLIRRTGLLGKYKKGLGHLQYRERQEACQIFLELAKSGHVQAQFDLGVMLWGGLESDGERALYWLETAASHKHADAENFLGSIYVSGYGATQDIEKALMYFKKSMDHGNKNARRNYAVLLAHGLPPEHSRE